MTGARPLLADLPQVYTSVNRADQLLVALDYDGTLAPIVDDPKDAAIPPEAGLALARLADANRCTLAIVSGRSLSDLKGRTTVDAVLAGNHGLEIEGRGLSFVHGRAQLLSTAVEDVCRQLDTPFRWVRGVIVECKHLGATVHFRQAPPELCDWIQATVEAVIRPVRHLFYVAPALQALEIRPRIAWNKGSAVRFLLRMMGAARPALICAGDDRTDEDMFGILPGEISVKIGAPTDTRARYFVRTPQEFRGFLQLLGEVAGQARPPGLSLSPPIVVAPCEARPR